MAFYEHPTSKKPQGFRDGFLNALSAFDGAICLITNQEIGDVSVQIFSASASVEDVLHWLLELSGVSVHEV